VIAAGATPKAVQSILGHASASFTLTVHGHLFDEDLDTLAAALDGIGTGTRRDGRGTAIVAVGRG
jgi:integrase